MTQFRTMSVTIHGPLVHIAFFMGKEYYEEIHIYGFRCENSRFVAWITGLDMAPPTYNSATEYMRYLDLNHIMYAEFGFYEEPQFGNWGVAAGIIDRLAKNNAETSFQNVDPDVSRAIGSAFKMWFGPSEYLTDKLYPL